MSCLNPPPLTDDQLSAALDNEPPPDVREHLETCPSCAAQLGAARRFERRLRGRLHRWGCPPPQQLGDYAIGLADQPTVTATAAHLATCVVCRSELDDLSQFLAEGEPQPAPGPTWRWVLPSPSDLIAILLPRTPALAMRGFAAGPLMAEVAGTTIMLDIQAADSGQVLVVGQVVDDDQDRWTGAQVELHHAAGALGATVDDLGGFRCGPLPAGGADLRITPAAGQAVVVPGIELQASAEPPH